jgi:hypothetical protein
LAFNFDQISKDKVGLTDAQPKHIHQIHRNLVIADIRNSAVMIQGA